jgi:hypothetical protein
MTHLAARGLLVDIQILDNKASAAYKKQSPSNGMQNSDLSHRTCIAKTVLNALFACSRTTSLQFWLVSTLHFHRTFGIFFWHRLNSPSNFFVRPLSTQGLVCGNFSKVPLTSTRLHLVRLVVASSSMQSWLLGNLRFPRKTRFLYWPCP